MSKKFEVMACKTDYKLITVMCLKPIVFIEMF